MRFKATFKESDSLIATFGEGQTLNADFGQVQKVSTSDYEELSNKPKINGVTLLGDKSFEDLGDAPLTNMEIKEIFNNIFGD